jgi:MULE transposase domain
MNKFQREQLLRLHKMIFIDGTHKVDIYGHQLFTVMAQDEFGHGVPVCFIITTSGKIDILEVALSVFKKKFEAYAKVELPCPICNAQPEDKCECVLDFRPTYVMCDDDLAEHEAIRRVFPHAQILLCHWHINVNWWRNSTALLKGDLKWQVFNILKRVIRASTFDRFNQLLEELSDLCDKEGTAAVAFWEYFENNYLGDGRPGK